jgi:hypothetical protein
MRSAGERMDIPVLYTGGLFSTKLGKEIFENG